jgi:hypothetical protein
MQEKAQSNISEEGRLELLRWFIDRSDGLRSSYSSRASLILSADALVLATLAFLLDKVPIDHPNKSYINWLIALSLASMLASFVLAFMASASFRKDTSQATKFHEKRYFFNATHTLNISEKDFDSFKRDFKTARIDELIDYACAQVWASYILQRKRYRNLKISILALLVAVITLIGALLTAFFT